MYTPVQVCNMALAKVANEAAQITSLPSAPNPEYPKEANLCSKFYPFALAEVLRSHTWNCAKKRTALALRSTTPTFGWSFKFALPADCEKPVACSIEANEWRSLRINNEWVVESGSILSNNNPLWLAYISNMDDLSTADSLFIQALYTNLAVKLAYPLTENRMLVRDLMNEYEQTIMPEAKRANTNEGNEFPIIDSEWIEATYSGGLRNTGRHTFAQTDVGSI